MLKYENSIQEDINNYFIDILENHALPIPEHLLPFISYKPRIRITSRGRVSKPPQYYSHLKWIPGSNNKYTAGRKCDQYDRAFNGHK
jgi:hypothetical protein